MNIFVSSPDPVECARVLDDKRVVKMTLETAQLLCTTLNLRGITTSYRSTHINHPCRKWIDESSANYLWLVQHYLALSNEYTKRFNKNHKCDKILIYCTSAGIRDTVETDRLTPFKNCTVFKDESNIYTAYRAALIKKWDEDKRPPKWTNAVQPTWYTNIKGQ